MVKFTRLLLVVLLISLLVCDSGGWRRRRRRRNCATGNWNNWNSCSANGCSSGTKSRYRFAICSNTVETRGCHGPCNCLVNGWSAWGACSEPCYQGVKYRYRSVGRSSSYGGRGCPSLSDSTSCNSQTHLKNCKIGGICHLDKHVRAGTCQVCDASSVRTRNSWQPQSGASCDDRNKCTRNDVCRKGRCHGTPFICSPCQYCDGSGCRLKEGYCHIRRGCYKDGQVNPKSRHCQYCSARLSRTSWTNRPIATPCADGDNDTRDAQCNAKGQCRYQESF